MIGGVFDDGSLSLFRGTGKNCSLHDDDVVGVTTSRGADIEAATSCIGGDRIYPTFE